MKNILKYLLLCCSALSLFGCEGLPRQDAAGRQDGRGCFHPFQRNGTTYQPSLFLRARRRPAAGAYPLFQRLGARRRVRRFVGRELAGRTSSTKATGNPVRNSTRNATPRPTPEPATLSACTLSRHPLCKRHSRRYREIQHRPTRRYTPERCRSVSARSISCAPTCTTAC